jgi:hypothetical protein
VTNAGYASHPGPGGFTPEGRAPEGRAPDGFLVSAHNRAVERHELDAWASVPTHFGAYISDAKVGAAVTTWLGTELGKVTACKVAKRRVGADMAYIRVRGSNGAEYFGRYGCEWSQYVHLKRVSGKVAS